MSDLVTTLVQIWSAAFRRPVTPGDDFFELGGDSLLGLQIVGKSLKEGIEFNIADLYEYPTIADLAARLGGSEAPAPAPAITADAAAGDDGLSDGQRAFVALCGDAGPPAHVAVADVEDAYRVTQAQEGTLLHARYDCRPGTAIATGVYVFQTVARLRGALEIEHVREAWLRVTRRHAILRGSFQWEGLEAPIQVIHREPVVEVAAHDWRAHGAPPDGQDVRLDEFLARDRARGIDLSRPGPCRYALIQRDDRVHDLVWTHYLAFDFWSQGLLWNEFVDTLAALQRGGEAEYEDSPPFRDYAAWLAGQDREAARAFWQQAMAGFREPTLLERAVATGFDETSDDRAGGVLQRVLPESFARDLRAFSRAHRMTMFSVVQAVWGLLIARYTGARDVAWGIESTVRPPDIEGSDRLIGFCLTATPMRATIEDDTTALEYLTRAARALARRHPYQYAALEDIHRWSGLPQGTPLMSTLVASFGVGAAGWRGVPGRIEVEIVRRQLAAHWSYELALVPGERVGLMAFYDRRALSDQAAAQILDHYQHLLASVVAEPHRRVSDLAVMSAAERRRITGEWNATETALPVDRALHAPFDDRAGAAPDAVAVIAGEREIGYRELAARADALAARLRAAGIGEGVCVGVGTSRDVDMIAAALAILRVGGAYVPLAPDLPAARLAAMIEDARVAAVVTEEGHRSRWQALGVKVVCADADGGGDAAADSVSGSRTASGARGDGLAYVIFTSGSTGRPKGVMVEHRAALNTILEVNRRFDIGAGDRALALSALGFDLSVYDLFGTLAAGGAIVLADAADRDPAAWARAVSEHRITVWNTVPALMEMLVEHAESHPDADLTSLRRVLLSGDWIPVGLPARILSLAPDAEVICMGGATEASIWSNYHRVRRADDVPPTWPSVPYGRPLANQRFYIMDAHRRPVPPLVAGDLYIAGAGVARGYAGREALTRARFLPDPFVRDPDARMYATGDRGRYLADGTIEFLGRLDDQVKIDGFRIELGEIEAVLAAHPAVKSAVAAVHRLPSGAANLVAFVVASAETSGDALARACADMLPAYMVPRRFAFVDAVPLTGNGKVDRGALLATLDHYEPLAAPREPARDPIERRLIAMWGELLGIETTGADAGEAARGIGRDDDFFALGGNSIAAARMIARVSRELGVSLPLAVLFEARTVAALAGVIASAGGDAAEPGPDAGAERPVGHRPPPERPRSERVDADAN